jgi:transcriptional regulator with XRE-family HTH domain
MVRHRRLDLAMSAEQLGAALKVSALQIKRWEAGIGRIGGEHLIGIARILGVGPDFFFEVTKPTLN